MCKACKETGCAGIAVGISNQRETTAIWNKDGRPLADAVVWQCSRAKGILDERKAQVPKLEEIVREKTGLPLSPYFPAAKMAWLLQNVSEESGQYYTREQFHLPNFPRYMPVSAEGPLTMETLLYIYGLQPAGYLAEFLGRREEARVYRERAKKAQESIRQYCVGENGMVQDGPGIDEYSQHCQVFALLTDTIELEQGKVNLLKTMEEPGYAQCTVAMRFYLFRALEKTGLYAYTDQYWDTWRKMVDMHCTTCVESEAYPRSECHGWGALILYELPSTILGVRPAEPGYKKVRIAPTPGYLTYASGRVKTPVGEIRVSWKKENGVFKVEHEVPQDIQVIQ